MKKKGFTLIELLAVIVILAIIVLIAIPIILNIIDGSRKSANKRSIELYGKVIEDAVANYIFVNPHDSNITVEKISQYIKYSGSEVECNIKINYNNTIYLNNCKINGINIEYTYGTKLDDKGDITSGAAKTLLDKSNDSNVTVYSSGNIHEMYTFGHSSTIQTEALIDYRYIGNAPYNYVTFNNETWRIIGVFTVENGNGIKEQRVKLMRNDSIGNYFWNSNGTNEWVGSSLQMYLSNEYYNSLSNDAKNMIEDTKYYLGGGSSSSGQSAPTYYLFERGKTTCSSLEKNPCETRNINWIGKIGIMYPSDYAYTYAYGVDEICYSDTYNCDTSKPSSGWIFNKALSQLLISPSVSLPIYSYCIMEPYGMIVNTAGVSRDAFSVRPTVYLNSKVRITGGTGEQGNPYTLSLN